MKHVDEFRDPQACRVLLDEIRTIASSPCVLMDVCGGQTHGLVKFGIEQELDGVIELIHGPGCPVCVTPAEAIDLAIELAMRPGVTVVSFGDMLRVPGSEQSLMQARAKGGDVEIVYSPIDAIGLAQRSPEQQFVFLAVGFETTAPATALAVLHAAELQLDNFSVLVSHVRVQPAMEAIMGMPGNRVQAFLAAGHVSTITGYDSLDRFASQFRVPVVVTGFEPIDLLRGILEGVRLVQAGEYRVSNQYGRNVQRQGNASAQTIIERVYAVATRPWRGFGEIPAGALQLREEFHYFDAQKRFVAGNLPLLQSPNLCRAAEVMTGKIKPAQCAAFGVSCTPLSPLGAPMVSSEGTCAAYYRFHGPVK